MIHLILTVVAIALTSMLALATINYLPWWQKSAADTDTMVRTSLLRIEQSYDVATRAANGTAPVMSGADGGFAATFVPILQFTPALPAGYEWSYGKQAADGTRYAGLNYFCLRQTAANTSGASEGVYRGFERVRATFSADQVFLTDDCATATANLTRPAAFPALAQLKMFVSYTPGITY